MAIRALFLVMLFSTAAFSQVPKIEPGVSQELSKWRAAHYSDVRYKLNLTLEKMSPVLKGTLEVRLRVNRQSRGGPSANLVTVEGVDVPPGAVPPGSPLIKVPIILDWRKIKGFEDRSTISNVTINGKPAVRSSSFSWPPVGGEMSRGSGGPPEGGTPSFGEIDEHLVFGEGVVVGENVIKLDFTSPILPSGSAITRYVDKEDGSEYIYSLFVPSDASTAFPVFDQPDLKARFRLAIVSPEGWAVVANTEAESTGQSFRGAGSEIVSRQATVEFDETKPISTYVFAFAAGPFEKFEASGGNASVNERGDRAAEVESSPERPIDTLPYGRVSARDAIYVRKSQAEKFKPHAAEVFRVNREAVRYFEEYFDYKFPFPKYDLVLIPEFPFGGMEHAGATFLREASVIFPQEPTTNDHVNRATLIFHEAAHQWFGDTVTMRWFDDLWLKEGFATFTAYKALEKIMPEMNAWKVFYERVKQGAYQTDSTRGTTPIYQEIPNLSAAKSAYGNIVYNKAPAFLRQAEFYLGEDKFRTAVRSFLKKHEFGNAAWEDLVKEFEAASGRQLDIWAKQWVTQRGMYIFHSERRDDWHDFYDKSKKAPPLIAITPIDILRNDSNWKVGTKVLMRYSDGAMDVQPEELYASKTLGGRTFSFRKSKKPEFIFPNYGDYGYGIFLLDAQSREYILKNIQNEKDPFLRSMMWGALWDSVREGELDPREYVELVVRVLSKSNAFTRESAGGEVSRSGPTRPTFGATTPKGVTLTEDESTTAQLLNRVGTALNYYIDESPAGGGKPPFRTAKGVGDLRSRVEDMLIAGMRNAPSQGQRITYYRAFLNVAASERARGVLKGMLKGGNPSGREGVSLQRNASGLQDTLPIGRVSASVAIPLKTKDKFDIVTRLLVLGDPEASALLAALEKTETSDEAKRYAYAAKAGIATAENKAKYWKDFTENKEISESWIEAAFGPWNSIRHSELTLPYLERALKELPNHKRNRKIFFVNGWLGAFIGGQRSIEALAIINKFLVDNPNLDRDLRLKILENSDIIERAVKIRQKHDRSV